MPLLSLILIRQFKVFQKMSKIQIDSLDDLIKKIREIFEDDVVNIDKVIQILKAYKSDPKDWRKYAFFDRFR